MVPLAAVVLRQLVAVAGPQRVMFSAYGLREGYAYGLVPPADDSPDPLLAGIMAIGRTESRFAPNGDRFQEWTAPLFPPYPIECGGCIGPRAGSATSPGSNIPTIAPSKLSRAA